MSTQPHLDSFKAFFPGMGGPAGERMSLIITTMREMSRQTDPESMVQAYSARMRQIFPSDRRVSISRRDLDQPAYRITRSSIWAEDINPWKNKERLPVHDSGLISDLIYSNEAHLVNDLEVAADDPAAEHLANQRSLIAIPLYDLGESLNMVLLTSEQPGAFSEDVLPELVWMSNLFGKATHSLVMAEQVREAYHAVDRELAEVAQIQRALLPAELPDIPGMMLATDYQTSRRAGGDYYDFFELEDGRWGLLIADVSGHGTPAAVVMSMTRTLAHAYPRTLDTPSRLLAYMNCHLCSYGIAGIFVTAFFGIFDPRAGTITYSSAGHNPPRVKHCSENRLSILDQAQSLPLGIERSVGYDEATIKLATGDQMVLYTDGITEAHARSDELFGVERLDQVLENCSIDAEALIRAVLDAVDAFTGGRPADDDRTLVVAKLT